MQTVVAFMDSTDGSILTHELSSLMDHVNLDSAGDHRLEALHRLITKARPRNTRTAAHYAVGHVGLYRYNCLRVLFSPPLSTRAYAKTARSLSCRGQCGEAHVLSISFHFR